MDNELLQINQKIEELRLIKINLMKEKTKNKRKIS